MPDMPTREPNPGMTTEELHQQAVARGDLVHVAGIGWLSKDILEDMGYRKDDGYQLPEGHRLGPPLSHGYFPVLVVPSITVALLQLRRSHTNPAIQLVIIPENGPETIIELHVEALRGLAAEIGMWA